MNTNSLLITLALVALVLAWKFGDKHPDTSREKLHCEMVQIWNETNGEYGWPDYNNTAGSSCPKEQHHDNSSSK
jgi:hypothetical protein